MYNLISHIFTHLSGGFPVQPMGMQQGMLNQPHVMMNQQQLMMNQQQV